MNMRIANLALCLALPFPAAPQDASPPVSPSTRVCIAMALPSVQGVEGSASDVAAAVRELFTNFLKGPSIDVVALDARLSSQANEEAKQKSCGHVLLVSLIRKRGGGGLLGRALGQAGTSAAWGLPAGGVAGAVVRSAVIAGAQVATDLASNTRANDEMRLQYRVASPDGRVIVKLKEEKSKASVNGEDLLTPLVQTASESIASEMKR